ncbi:hypothetical protein FJR45_11120 [Sulfurimonas sediminis]|uniref:ATPase dynein-related AAA domain-containing protein n=1 Tax=Sulfurimonas sediminis TaxID=2590020 RepID=A0A7M1B3Z7_9BACT|nr:AAA family ATPase [Sulfurimonas sediminis]QOP44469.1 hypothetical protein FJR45_11120 [Sulfurimonas sediminis]
MAYYFNGKRINALNRLVIEIVKKYVSEHPNISYIDLKKVFRDEIGGSRGIIKNKQDFEIWKQNIKDPEKRFFIKDNEIVKLANDEVYINQGWGGDWQDSKSGKIKEGNKKRFLEFAKNELHYEIEIDSINEEEKDLIREDKNILNIKNIILYGAPGVGKTHNYQNLISMIEEGKSQKEIFDTISQNEKVSLNDEIFQTIQDEKRVEFVTFHQSYSYEDFIEGFRPNENGNIELEDGIFKRVSAKAINQVKEKELKHISFDEAYDIFRTSFINEELETLKKVTGASIIIHDVKEKTILLQSENAKDSQYVKKNDLGTVVNAMLRDKIHKPVDIKNLDVKKDTISLSDFYYPLAKKIVEIIKKNRVDVKNEKNFYIVIDEINRGNISKIFGELITLIEEDKRDIYEVTLPYSKEKFKVPSNLYIIATMNSTDKSIATIDIALRRRFTFLKMKPNLELVKNDSARECMQELNNYITAKLSEDYQLGHSYFMNVQNDEDLIFVKEYKIKPLLEEYFYADEKSADEIMKEVLREK